MFRALQQRGRSEAPVVRATNTGAAGGAAAAPGGGQAAVLEAIAQRSPYQWQIQKDIATYA